MRESGERGTLTIDDRVVERLASCAVSLVPGAGAAPRRFLGVAVGDAEDDRDATVTARVDVDVVSLTVSTPSTPRVR